MNRNSNRSTGKKKVSHAMNSDCNFQDNILVMAVANFRLKV